MVHMVVVAQFHNFPFTHPDSLAVWSVCAKKRESKKCWNWVHANQPASQPDGRTVGTVRSKQSVTVHLLSKVICCRMRIIRLVSITIMWHSAFFLATATVQREGNATATDGWPPTSHASSLLMKQLNRILVGCFLERGIGMLFLAGTI